MIEVSCALIILNGKVLIAQNGADSDHAFMWEFPGGKIHANESAQSCIIREIHEELELEIRVEDELIPVEHDYGIKRINLIPLICKIVSGNVNLKEHLAFKWVNVDQLLRENLSEADLKLILLPENQRRLKEYIWE